MKKEIAMMWADMLESDILEQTDSVLENKQGGNCCLGVLCRMYEKEVKLKVKPNSNSIIEFNGCGYGLPTELKSYVGMKSEIGLIPSLKNTLANINDVEGKTFPEIAKIIRKHYKEL